LVTLILNFEVHKDLQRRQLKMACSVPHFTVAIANTSDVDVVCGLVLLGCYNVTFTQEAAVRGGFQKVHDQVRCYSQSLRASLARGMITGFATIARLAEFDDNHGTMAVIMPSAYAYRHVRIGAVVVHERNMLRSYRRRAAFTYQEMLRVTVGEWTYKISNLKALLAAFYQLLMSFNDYQRRHHTLTLENIATIMLVANHLQQITPAVDMHISRQDLLNLVLSCT
ncbi:hypothetical protein HDU76_007593, partial [Blyttiomyces sp. JEL0837]